MRFLPIPRSAAPPPPRPTPSCAPHPPSPSDAQVFKTLLASMAQGPPPSALKGNNVKPRFSTVCLPNEFTQARPPKQLPPAASGLKTLPLLQQQAQSSAGLRLLVAAPTPKAPAPLSPAANSVPWARRFRRAPAGPPARARPVARGAQFRHLALCHRLLEEQPAAREGVRDLLASATGAGALLETCGAALTGAGHPSAGIGMLLRAKSAAAPAAPAGAAAPSPGPLAPPTSAHRAFPRLAACHRLLPPGRREMDALMASAVPRDLLEACTQVLELQGQDTRGLELLNSARLEAPAGAAAPSPAPPAPPTSAHRAFPRLAACHRLLPPGRREMDALMASAVPRDLLEACTQVLELQGQDTRGLELLNSARLEAPAGAPGAKGPADAPPADRMPQALPPGAFPNLAACHRLLLEQGLAPQGVRAVLASAAPRNLLDACALELEMQGRSSEGLDLLLRAEAGPSAPPSEALPWTSLCRRLITPAPRAGVSGLETLLMAAAGAQPREPVPAESAPRRSAPPESPPVESCERREEEEEVCERREEEEVCERREEEEVCERREEEEVCERREEEEEVCERYTLLPFAHAPRLPLRASGPSLYL